MSSKLTLVLFVTAVLLTSTLAMALPAVSGLEQRTDFTDQHTTALYGNSHVCGDHICAPGEHQKMMDELSSAQRANQVGHNMTTQALPPGQRPGEMPAQNMTQAMPTQNMPAQTTPAPTMPAQNMTQAMPAMAAPTWTTTTGTITSVQDPGQGHEGHQLAVILAPSSKIYTGVVTWTASEPIQIVELTGPLGQNDSKGQPVWTTDGTTKFALTLVDVNASSGSFAFTGNALALHQMTTTQFTASYAVSYTQSDPSDTVKTGTLTSIQDPGKGHESHQLALILPPSAKPYHGTLTYSASENVQLVSLIGPIDANDSKGQPVYTIDGQNYFGLVFVDAGNQMGTWQFAGNALAVHTLHTTPFQVSYTVSAHQ